VPKNRMALRILLFWSLWFNLDGLDGYNNYFLDVRKEEFFLSPHHIHSAGGGAVSFYGTCGYE